MAFENWAWILILVIEILVVTLVLYLSMRFICGRKRLDGSYFMRLLLVAIILAVGVTAIAYAVNQITSVFAPMFYVFLTVGFILVIRYLLTTPAVIPYHEHSADKYWQWSIWITLLSLVMIFLIAFLVELISDAIGQPIDILPHF
ncbi:MAG: hypothetical protein GF308_13630 [Candidatus Heimdallarchaeota archaeon]|nr:hypothetical protein [Candidatus Heimdallarchaeota archaeon]